MDFSQLVRTRYSVRSYKDMPIPDEILEQILEAGRLAPSAHNTQPQMIYVAKSKEARDKIASVCPCTFGAPMILVIAYDKERQRMSRLNPSYGFGENDTAITVIGLLLLGYAADDAEPLPLHSKYRDAEETIAYI